MSKRRDDSASESLAEALSRVMVTRDQADHRDNYTWATVEGRGDRMPRFLERAIVEVPHAAQPAGTRAVYQGRTRRPFARTTLLLSCAAIAAGVAVSVVSPGSIAPMLDTLRHASMNLSLASNANAATPRLGFGEMLRNYSDQASAQAARANIIVSDLVPGTTLSSGAPVSETSWSLPQSDLDNVVITFPNGVPAAAMRATVEIPGNTAASSGKFKIEMRQAGEAVVEGEPSSAADAAAEATAPPAAEDVPAKAAAETDPAKAAETDPAQSNKGVVKAKAIDPAKAQKRKPRPSASLSKSNTIAAASAAAKAVLPSNPATSASSKAGPALADLLPTINAPSPNALMMFNLGGPVTE
jgi:hypothetical protein